MHVFAIYPCLATLSKYSQLESRSVGASEANMIVQVNRRLIQYN